MSEATVIVCGQDNDPASCSRMNPNLFALCVCLPLFFPLLCFLFVHRKTYFSGALSRCTENAGGEIFRRRQSTNPNVGGTSASGVEMEVVQRPADPLVSLTFADPNGADADVGGTFALKHTQTGHSLSADVNGTPGQLCTLKNSGEPCQFQADGGGRWKLVKTKRASEDLYLSVFGGTLQASNLITVSKKDAAVVFQHHDGLLRACKKSGAISKYFVKAASQDDNCFLMLADVQDKSKDQHSFSKSSSI